MAVPYAISNGAVCSAILEGRLISQQILFTLHYQYSGPLLPDGYAALGTLATALNTVGGVSSNYAACTPENLTTLQWRLQWIVPDRYVARVVASVPAVGTGTNADTANVQAALTLQTNFADRRGKGTKHIVLAPTDIVAGLVSPAQRTALAGLGVACGTSLVLGAGVMDPILYGRPRAAYTKDGVFHPALPQSIRLLSGYVVGSTARVQRRRTVGVGS